MPGQDAKTTSAEVRVEDMKGYWLEVVKRELSGLRDTKNS
jgi:hypothetical protein